MKTKGGVKPKAELRDVDPLDLLLDPHNPRLSADEEGSSQPELMKIMIERFKLEELAESMIAAGYLEFDPLVAIQENDELIIVEGNRRIAVLQLLLKPNLAPDLYRETWMELSKRVSTRHRPSFSPVRVLVYPDREDPELTSYMGFRHVTGVLQWPALEKATFIAELIRREGWDYERIADRLGSYPRHVERHYVAHQIVEQARKEDIDTKSIEERSFGVLLRALQAKGVVEFLGVSFPGNPAKSKRPVPRGRIENLKNFIEWTFGTKDKPKILQDSRLLTKWGRILQSPEAVGYLKRTEKPSFDRAYFRSGGQVESLADALAAAADRLEESVPIVSEHVRDGEIQGWIRRCTNFLVQILAHFPTIRKEFGIPTKK